jgi:hypothetical protein
MWALISSGRYRTRAPSFTYGQPCFRSLSLRTLATLRFVIAAYSCSVRRASKARSGRRKGALGWDCFMLGFSGGTTEGNQVVERNSTMGEVGEKSRTWVSSDWRFFLSQETLEIDRCFRRRRKISSEPLIKLRLMDTRIPCFVLVRGIASSLFVVCEQALPTAYFARLNLNL